MSVVNNTLGQFLDLGLNSFHVLLMVFQKLLNNFQYEKYIVTWIEQGGTIVSETLEKIMKELPTMIFEGLGVDTSHMKDVICNMNLLDMMATMPNVDLCMPDLGGSREKYNETKQETKQVFKEPFLNDIQDFLGLDMDVVGELEGVQNVLRYHCSSSVGAGGVAGFACKQLDNILTTVGNVIEYVSGLCLDDLIEQASDLMTEILGVAEYLAEKFIELIQPLLDQLPQLPDFSSLFANVESLFDIFNTDEFSLIQKIFKTTALFFTSDACISNTDLKYEHRILRQCNPLICKDS